MQQTEAFRGWKIVVVAFFAQALAFGLTIIPYGLFIEPVVAEYGVSVMTVNLGLTLLIVVMTAVGPVFGPLLDRYSIRALMCFGAVLLSVTLAIMSVTTSLTGLAAEMAIGIAIGVTLLGPLASTTVVAKWFEVKRGRAVGFAAMGPPAGGFVITPIAGALIESFGWRTTLQCFAVIVLLIVPFIWAVIRNKPSDLGQYPDGVPPAVDTPVEVTGAGVWSAKTIFAARNFWVMALAFGIVFGIGGGWNANLPKYAVDLEYSIQEASYLLSFGAFMGIPGTLLFGALADRLDNRLLTWSIIAIQAFCFALLVTAPGYFLLLGLISIFGLSAGGLLPVYASLIGRLFGPANFGQVMGLAGLVALPFGAVAPPLAGYLRDVGGNYNLTLTIFFFSFCVSAVILIALRQQVSRAHLTGADLPVQPSRQNNLSA